MIETKLNGTTPDIAEENIAKLKEIFPDVFCEGKIDFDKFQQVLGNYIEDENERYNFSWNGKGRSLRLAQSPSTGTLRPCKEESKDWDTTENLYIEGDNLEVLKLLQKSYHGKIKMIYIDPPYNTGHDFVYPDDYRDNMQNYLELTGQVDSDCKKISTNSESNGRYHTDWLNMMYPRLRLARNLLTDDGVIFISIDDNEDGNLRKLCDEIFGEDNFVAQIIWRKKYGAQNDAKWFSVSHDYIVVYAKNKFNWHPNLLPRTDEADKRYKNPDNDPRGVWKSTDFSRPAVIDECIYDITLPSGRVIHTPQGRSWLKNKVGLDELILDNRIWFGSNGDSVPSVKRFLSEVKDGMVCQTFWDYSEVGHTDKAAKDLSQIIGQAIFDYPKPIDLIKRILQISTEKDSIILDFFSGSATTAHAVMQLNAEDDGNRKFICVQLPEPCDEKSEAFKAGYKNICEIGKERIRRAGEKINYEILESNKQITFDGEEKKLVDVGFKVLKLDSSNIRRWNPDFENIERTLWERVDNLVEGRNELDLVYEIMLKYGLDLTYPVEEFFCGNKKVYSIGFGMLVICVAEDISLDVAKFIADYKKQSNIEEMRVVFKDSSFDNNDSLKINTKEILKVAGVEEFITM